MEDCSKTVLRRICCTCLSTNRKLFKLCRLVDGVNTLYLLLSFDTEAYREGFKDTANLFICWECKGIMKKISIFRRNACIAQQRLTAIVDEQNDIKLNHKSLSSLMTSIISFVTVTPEIVLPESDNFIDCGQAEIKTETDVDDVPLSEMQDDCDNMYAISNESDLKELIKDIKIEVTENDVEEEINKKSIKEPKAEKRKITTESAFNKDANKIYCDTSLQNNEGFPPEDENLERKQHKTMACDKKTRFGFRCPQCDQSFENKKLRYKHIKMNHCEGYPCTICGKKFPFKHHLKIHEKIHVPTPREKCPKCDKMIRVDLMKTHSKIHTSRDQFTCVECNRTYISKESYENHLKYNKAHSDTIRFKCDTCDKGYRSKGELRDHINYQHLGKTQHKCPICNKALATRRCITRHVRRAHQNIKEGPLNKICQQCGKAFRDKKSLREHEFIHTGERPLSCEICGSTFRQNSSLYTHKKRVHNIYPKKRTVELQED